MSDRQFITNVDGIGVVCVDCFGVGGLKVIRTPKGLIPFEWSDRFGPLPITATGRQLDLGPRHPFWRAVSLWVMQGRRLKNTNEAEWHEPRAPTYKHMGGRHYLIEDPGDHEYWIVGPPPKLRRKRAPAA